MADDAPVPGKRRRSKPRRLTYSEYINDRAVVEALRIPQPPPAGQAWATWPRWAAMNHSRTPGVAAWAPGEPWPEGKNWSHHEVLFIRTHQAFEVWFAVVLHELGAVMRQAEKRAEVSGSSLKRVELGKRRNEGVEFSPTRFPRLARVAGSFKNDYIKNRVFLMPTPGRHSIGGETFSHPADLLQDWAATIRRAAAALAVTIPFFDVLATLTPREFLQFRGRLAPASGFGSRQFREIEMVLGLCELNRPRLRPIAGTVDPESDGPPIPEGMLRPTAETPGAEAATSFYYHHPPADWPALVKRFNAPSLRDLVYGLLNFNFFNWPGPAAVDEDFDEFAATNVVEALSQYDRAPFFDENRVGDHIDGLGEVLSHKETNVAALLEMRADGAEQHALLELLDACMEVDSALLRWRDHHIRFVEAMIGRRPGTGGGGVTYLRQTTDAGLATYVTHAFPCLWQARSLVQAS